jgi:hypothetical protein
MNFIRKWSFDIVLGAIASVSFAAEIAGIKLEAIVYVILGTVVFLIYGFDRLADSILLDKDLRGKNQILYFRHRKILLGIYITLGFISVSLSLIYLRYELLIFGIFISVAMLLYFSFLFIPELKGLGIFFKEIWVSAIYTICIWGIPASYSSWSVFKTYTPLIVVFFFLTLTNVFIFSFFGFGFKRYGRHVHASIIISFLLLLLTSVFYSFKLEAYLVLFPMIFLLGSILLFKDFMMKKKIYGILADAAFIIPGLIWLIN